MAFKPVGVDENDKFPARVESRLNGQFVRFEDENGNPLEGKTVVIKVSSTTGDILDIVSEA